MSLNLSKRIVTSLTLLVILFVCILLNKFLWCYLLVVISIIAFDEFSNLSKKIFKKQIKKKLIFNFISIIYLFIFVLVGYILNNTSSLNLLFILLICIFSDTGGYLIGKLIGGKKLTKISPNKTISGSIGSFIFSLIPVIIFVQLNNKNYEFVTHDNMYLISICLFLSLICQLGDLFISFFKRKAKMKDTGTILPGHGGLLDRIDGFIFVLPASFILIKLIN